MTLDYATLKARQREIRGSLPPALSLRVHRALSWLNRAERAEDDDARFIFLWIAFNAAYATELEDRRDFSERLLFIQFLRRLIDADEAKLIHDLVWQQYSGKIRLLLDNRYVFKEFWDYNNGTLTDEEWRRRFSASKARANRALAAADTLTVLSVLLDRLYVLRNQLVHGGATWNGSMNRDQVRDGAAIMGMLVPIMIHLMMGLGHQEWANPCYPVVD